MLTLALKSSEPESELYLLQQNKIFEEIKWIAHRELAETIHKKMSKILDKQHISWHDIDSIIVFKGPGSFTGLRIGISVVNTLAYSLKIPLVSVVGDDWLTQGQRRLKNNENDEIVIPEYGSLPHITQPKH